MLILCHEKAVKLNLNMKITVCLNSVDNDNYSFVINFTHL